MKAAILEKFDKVTIGELQRTHHPLECGQVVVKIICSTICGAQIGEITGAKGEDSHLPHLLGHEGCAEVTEIGPGVTNVKVGDRVVMHWRKGAGIDAKPAAWWWEDKKKLVGSGPVTTFSEYSIVSENRLTAINRKVPPSIASLMGCAVTTAFGLINNEAKLKIGESICIAGIGGVGLNLIGAADIVGAHPIMALDRDDWKSALAKLTGADYFFTEIGSLPLAPDVFVDCTGDPDIIDFGFKCLKSNGRMILVGQPHYLSKVIFHTFRQNYKGKAMMDSQGGLTNPTEDIPRYIDLYLAGKVVLDHVITHKYPLSEINSALEVVMSNKCGRVLLEMT